jgi:hypothetical protein
MVEVTLSFDDGFALRYVVEGAVGDIVLPPGDGQLVIADSATDGLWQGTCFEAFLTEEGAARLYRIQLCPRRPLGLLPVRRLSLAAPPRRAGAVGHGRRTRRRALCAARRAGDFPRYRRRNSRYVR